MRYQSLDIFKALGIIYLVSLHQMIWLFTYADGNSLRFDEAMSIIYPFGYRSGLHVFGFQVPLLAGVTFYLSTQAKNLKFKNIFQRGLMLIFSGYLMNVLAWGVEDFWAWDVLQFLGLAMIMSFGFLRNNVSLFFLSIAGIIALTLSNSFPFMSYSDNYLYKIFIGDPSGNNYWPMCPWFFIFVVGILLGKFFFQQKAQPYIFYISGLILMSASFLNNGFFAVVNLDQIWGAPLFKPSAYFITGIAGFSCVAIPIIEKLMSQSDLFRKIINNKILGYLGRNIFWVYILSTIIGYHGTISFIMNFPDMSFVQTAVAFFVFIILNLVICFWLVKFIDYFKGKIVKDGIWQN